MSWQALDSAASKGLFGRLTKEVGEGHVLFERLRNLQVVASSAEGDDILVTDREDEDRAFVVHLVWGEETPDRNPEFPHASALDRSDVDRILGAIAPN